MVRPELVSLKLAERERVLENVAKVSAQCDTCGGTDFDVGDALYLGFLFLDADQDDFMVALICRNADCPNPRTGIILPDKAFLLNRVAEARAASWTVAVPDKASPGEAAHR
jgi:hypothetical protein